MKDDLENAYSEVQQPSRSRPINGIKCSLSDCKYHEEGDTCIAPDGIVIVDSPSGGHAMCETYEREGTEWEVQQ